ncbi:hypothetical protein BGZ81_009643 [Podila clonocystis]|nr:hypothetical protein BGZ81_009643 [Podila clonocystis]
MDEGQLWLDEKTPEQWGIPTWRSRVMYIPQRTAVLEGTPLDFVEQVRSFAVHRRAKTVHADPVEIALEWGIRPELWHSRWNTLSGGEMQRISLAIGCSMQPDILLLDEPTSALDEESCAKVEKTLRQVNCIWVTHNPQQAKRIATAGQLNMQGGDHDGSQSPTPTPSQREEVNVNSHESRGSDTAHS